MKTNTAYQEKTKEELLTLLAENDSHINQQSQQIDALSEVVRILKYRQFGRKSESIPAEQFSIFNEAELPKKIADIEQADEQIHIAAYTRTKSVGRKPLPENLPRDNAFMIYLKVKKHALAVMR